MNGHRSIHPRLLCLCSTESQSVEAVTCCGNASLSACARSSVLNCAQVLAEFQRSMRNLRSEKDQTRLIKTLLMTSGGDALKASCVLLYDALKSSP